MEKFSILVCISTVAVLFIGVSTSPEDEDVPPSHKQGEPSYHNALDLMNNYRKDHGAPPLEPSEKLATLARAHADKLASHPRCKLSKSENAKKYGESEYSDLNAYPIFKTIEEVLLDSVIDWYGEVYEYNFENPAFNKSSQHFTQMIWKSSKYVGMGVARNPTSNCIVVVALYDPQGNLPDDMERNVLPNIHPAHPDNDVHNVTHHKHAVGKS